MGLFDGFSASEVLKTIKAGTDQVTAAVMAKINTSITNTATKAENQILNNKGSTTTVVTPQQVQTAENLITPSTKKALVVIGIAAVFLLFFMKRGR